MIKSFFCSFRRNLSTVDSEISRTFASLTTSMRLKESRRETNKLRKWCGNRKCTSDEARSTLQRCSHDIGMLQTNLAEMEGGGEIIVADRPDTLRATTLALAQRGQFHSYAKNSHDSAGPSIPCLRYRKNGHCSTRARKNDRGVYVGHH